MCPVGTLLRRRLGGFPLSCDPNEFIQRTWGHSLVKRNPSGTFSTSSVARKGFKAWCGFVVPACCRYLALLSSRPVRSLLAGYAMSRAPRVWFAGFTSLSDRGEGCSSIHKECQLTAMAKPLVRIPLVPQRGLLSHGRYPTMLSAASGDQCRFFMFRVLRVEDPRCFVVS